MDINRYQREFSKAVSITIRAKVKEEIQNEVLSTVQIFIENKTVLNSFFDLYEKDNKLVEPTKRFCPETVASFMSVVCLEYYYESSLLLEIANNEDNKAAISKVISNLKEVKQIMGRPDLMHVQNLLTMVNKSINNERPDIPNSSEKTATEVLEFISDILTHFSEMYWDRTVDGFTSGIEKAHVTQTRKTGANSIEQRMVISIHTLMADCFGGIEKNDIISNIITMLFNKDFSSDKIKRFLKHKKG